MKSPEKEQEPLLGAKGTLECGDKAEATELVVIAYKVD